MEFITVYSAEGYKSFCSGQTRQKALQCGCVKSSNIDLCVDGFDFSRVWSKSLHQWVKTPTPIEKIDLMRVYVNGQRFCSVSLNAVKAKLREHHIEFEQRTDGSLMVSVENLLSIWNTKYTDLAHHCCQ